MTSVSGSGTRMSYFRVQDGVLSRMPNLDPKLYPEQLIDFGNTSGYFFITAFWYWSHLGAFVWNGWSSFDFGQLVLPNYWMSTGKDFSVEP